MPLVTNSDMVMYQILSMSASHIPSCTACGFVLQKIRAAMRDADAGMSNLGVWLKG